MQYCSPSRKGLSIDSPVDNTNDFLAELEFEPFCNYHLLLCLCYRTHFIILFSFFIFLFLSKRRIKKFEKMRTLRIITPPPPPHQIPKKKKKNLLLVTYSFIPVGVRLWLLRGIHFSHV